MLGLVGVALEHGLQRKVVVDPVKARRDQRRERQVGVEVRPAGAVLEAKRRPVANDPQSAGAVVVTPGDRGWREGSRRISLVGVDVGGEHQRQLAERSELTGEKESK